mmetsp:Transcript_4507/g.9390  ORF Transcript_4507/g.9390 Transcript_4507/m.9390 type:complete len:298 (-) Transcript_4507:577-1470(-)
MPPRSADLGEDGHGERPRLRGNEVEEHALVELHDGRTLEGAREAGLQEDSDVRWPEEGVPELVLLLVVVVGGVRGEGGLWERRVEVVLRGDSAGGGKHATPAAVPRPGFEGGAGRLSQEDGDEEGLREEGKATVRLGDVVDLLLDGRDVLDPPEVLDLPVRLLPLLEQELDLLQAEVGRYPADARREFHAERHLLVPSHPGVDRPGGQYVPEQPAVRLNLRKRLHVRLHVVRRRLDGVEHERRPAHHPVDLRRVLFVRVQVVAEEVLDGLDVEALARSDALDDFQGGVELGQVVGEE